MKWTEHIKQTCSCGYKALQVVVLVIDMLNSVCLEFTDELCVVDFIKCLSEFKDADVCLVTYLHVTEKRMRELNKLCFAEETFAEGDA